jgi:ABC-type branched-subunit amino acid transport system substrate-binding protein
MARNSFRTTVAGAALTLFALAIATQLSGCTAPAAKPQAVEAPAPPPVVQTPLPPPPVATTVVQSPEDAVTAGRPKVALLVPLTGPNASVGQAMLDAAHMALFEVSADIALMPRDTGGTPDAAAAAAHRAMSDNVGLVLGPIFSAAVAPVREAVGGSATSAIAYTTDATAAGGNIFVMGFLPAGQVDRVVGFAKSRGMTKLAALVPDNAYGAAVTSEISLLHSQLGLAPPRVLTITRDVKGQLASLASDPPEMLLVALGGDQLVNLAPAIADYASAHPVQLLGTGLWADDPTVAQTPALAGGWYASPVPGNFDDFVSRFQRNFNYRPPRIASLAYDSVALAAAISRSAGGNPNPFNRDVLLQPNGFIGIDGAFRFLPTGLSERNLAVLAVNANGPTVVDPPPPDFQKLGE